MQTKELLDICTVLTSVVKLNPVKPLTELCEFYAVDGIFHIGMTDGIIRVVATLPTDIEIPNAVINIRRLQELLKLTSKSEISLTHKGDYISFKGNGRYKLNIMLDECGNDIHIKLKMPELPSEYTIGLPSDYKKMLDRNKITLAEDSAMPMLQRYGCINGKVVTTNSETISATTINGMCYEQMFSALVTQLAQLPDEFKWAKINGGLRISCQNFELYSMIGCPDDFPIPVVTTVLNADTTCKLKVNQSDLLDALKRLAVFKSAVGTTPLFVSVFPKRLMVSNTSAQEDIPCEIEKYTNEVHMKFKLNVVLNILKKMEKSELICELNDMFIKITDSIGSYIIGRFEDDEEEN